MPLVDVNIRQPRSSGLEDFGIRTNTILKQTSPSLAALPQVSIEPKPAVAIPKPAAPVMMTAPVAFAEPSSTMRKLDIAETVLQLIGLTAPLWLTILLTPSRR